MSTVFSLSQNIKMERSSDISGVTIMNFAIPADKTEDGFITCPMAGPCKDFCYAKERLYKMPNVKAKHGKNLDYTRSAAFVERMWAEILLREPDFVRVHDSGDYYNEEYLAKWFAIAKRHQQVKFYSYTNSISMVRGAYTEGSVPRNYDFIYSGSGGLESHLIDRSVERHSLMFRSIEQMEAAGYANANENDLLASKFFTENNRIGLKFKKPAKKNGNKPQNIL